MTRSFSVSSPLTGDERVLFEVAWQHQAKEDGKAEDKEVPGGVEVHKLQVGQSDGRDHSKEGAEQSSQDGIGQGRKQSAEFTHEAQQQHHGGSVLNHTSAANLGTTHREKKKEDTDEIAAELWPLVIRFLVSKTSAEQRHSSLRHLCDSQDTNIGTGGGGTVSRPKKTIQHTGDTFHKYPPAELQWNKGGAEASNWQPGLIVSLTESREGEMERQPD